MNDIKKPLSSDDIDKLLKESIKTYAEHIHNICTTWDVFKEMPYEECIKKFSIFNKKEN